jgi:hypothetical protein
MIIPADKVEKLIRAKLARLPKGEKQNRLRALIPLMRAGQNSPGFTLLQQRKIYHE